MPFPVWRSASILGIRFDEMSRTTSTVMSAYSASNAAFSWFAWSRPWAVYHVTVPSSLAAVTMASHSAEEGALAADSVPAGPVGSVVTPLALGAEASVAVVAGDSVPAGASVAAGAAVPSPLASSSSSPPHAAVTSADATRRARNRGARPRGCRAMVLPPTSAIPQDIYQRSGLAVKAPSVFIQRNFGMGGRRA